MEYPCKIGSREPADIEKISNAYSFEEAPHEFIVAVADETAKCYATQVKDYYMPAQLIILGYHDLTNGRKSRERARMDWALTEYERVSEFYKSCFKGLTAYRVIGYPAKIMTTPPFINPLGLGAESFNNPFRLGGLYVTEILEKGAQDEYVSGLIEEFLKPQVLHSDILGDLELDRRCGVFKGVCGWLGNSIGIRIAADDSRIDVNKQIKSLESLVRDSARWDGELRAFAAKDLTDTANEWLADYNYDAEEKLPPVTEADFARRIVLSSIHLSGETAFEAYFDDDGMFAGHTVTVSADTENGAVSADLMG